MTEKGKYIYTPSGAASTSALRSSYQTSLHSPPTQMPFMSFNSSMTLDNKQQPSQESTAPSQYKNLSLSMQQFERKMDNIYPNYKKDEQNTLKPGSDQAGFLRSSVSSNQINKLDKDFLRKTAYTPTNSKTFNIEQRYEDYQPPPVSVPDQKVSDNNLFHKKGAGGEATDKKSPSSAFFKSLSQHHEEKQTDSPEKRPSGTLFKGLYSQEERPSMPKRPSSQVVCGFYLGKQLGVGKFGEVYLAKHIASGFVCALKKIVKAKVREYNMVAQLTQEIKIQAFLNHPNIVQLYSVASDEQNIYLVLEYMEGGTLFDYMNVKEVLPEPEAVVFLREIGQALKEIHDKDIAHRDLKPENIVMSYGFSKLCDFGWAARVQGARRTFCGTKEYVPPEILQRKEYDQTVDLWCLGILAFELLTGKVPFEHKEKKMLIQKIVNVDKDKLVFPETLSPVARDFIENLIKKNPNERMKAYKLLQHPFLAQEQRRDQRKK